MGLPRIYLSSPHMGTAERRYVEEAFNSNWIAPLGPHVDAFEAALARYTGVQHTAALSSGTAAIHLALVMLGVGPGDYVICQSMTFSATANPIRYLGAIPVFIDSEPTTWNMCPNALEEALRHLTNNNLSGQQPVTYNPQPATRNAQLATHNPQPATRNPQPATPNPQPATRNAQRATHNPQPATPKAILPVHLYGMPARMDDIMTVAARYDIPVVEDAAEALGSAIGNRMCGSMGNMGVLSFNGNKIITTSGGGALLSDKQELIERARFLATQARDPAPHYQHSHIGYNYRMSNVLAGIGRGQLEVLDTRVAQRRANYDFYHALLANMPGISFVDEPEGYFSNRWLTTILADPVKTGGITRETIRLALEKENIESRPLWYPMHLQPVFDRCLYYGGEVARTLFEQGLCLPSGSNLSDHDRERIARVLKKVLKMDDSCV